MKKNAMEQEQLVQNKLQEKESSPELDGLQSVAPPSFGLNAEPVQKKESEEDEIQKKDAGKGGQSFAPVQKMSSGAGAGLPNDTQSKMESSFGADFSGVNFHPNSESATNMGALAYAQGNDVHFAPGQFNPGTQSGDELIGHELAHVEQQRAGRVQPTQQAKGMNVNADAGLEKEADDQGRMAAAGKAVQKKAATGAGGNNGEGSAQLKTNGEDPLKVDQGQITFDSEGNDSAGSRYFSRVIHWPGGASGVTIGRGYDLGHRSKDEVIGHLTAAGVSSGQASTLAGGAGLKGKPAGDWVKANKSKVGEITHEQQKILFEVVYAEHKKDVVRLSSKKDVVAAYGSTDFNTLHPAITDLLVDLRYRGDYKSSTRKIIQEHVAKNDLKKLAEIMADPMWKTTFGVPNDRFERRKKFMQDALAGKVDGGTLKGGETKQESGNGGSDAAGQESGTPIGSGTVTASALNVRSAPGGSKVGSPLKKGATVSVFAEQNGWYMIGAGQWVSGKFVEFAKAAPKPKPDSTTPIGGGSVTASSLNVRSGPGASNKKVGSPLSKGAAVEIFEEKDGWVRIGDNRWVSGKYIDRSGKAATPPKPQPIGAGKVSASKLNVRSGPGGSNKKVGEPLPNGSEVTIWEESQGWYRIGDGQWVSAKYVTMGSGQPTQEQGGTKEEPKQEPKQDTPGTDTGGTKDTGGTSNSTLGSAYVTVSSLNVRKGPGGNFEKNGPPVTSGAKVTLFQESAGWYRIGPDQWVSGKYLSNKNPNAIPENKGGKPSWLSIAEAEMGQKELKGDGKHNDRIVEYHSTTGGWKNDEVPWCASFVNWVYKKAGITPTGSAAAMSFANWGTNVGRPAYGALAVFSYGGGKGHVGWVVGTQGDKILVLGGNQSDSVKISAFSKSKVVAYAVPPGHELPAEAYNLSGSDTKHEDSGGLAGTR